MRRGDMVNDGRQSTYGCVPGSRAVVHISRNETLRGSWQAELTLGPADHIIIDGRSATHAVQELLAILPAALAARIALAYTR